MHGENSQPIATAFQAGFIPGTYKNLLAQSAKA